MKLLLKVHKWTYYTYLESNLEWVVAIDILRKWDCILNQLFSHLLLDGWVPDPSKALFGKLQSVRVLRKEEEVVCKNCIDLDEMGIFTRMLNEFDQNMWRMFVECIGQWTILDHKLWKLVLEIVFLKVLNQNLKGMGSFRINCNLEELRGNRFLLGCLESFLIFVLESFGLVICSLRKLLNDDLLVMILKVHEQFLTEIVAIFVDK